MTGSSSRLQGGQVFLYMMGTKRCVVAGRGVERLRHCPGLLLSLGVGHSWMGQASSPEGKRGTQGRPPELKASTGYAGLPGLALTVVRSAEVQVSSTLARQDTHTLSSARRDTHTHTAAVPGGTEARTRRATDDSEQTSGSDPTRQATSACSRSGKERGAECQRPLRDLAAERMANQETGRVSTMGPPVRGYGSCCQGRMARSTKQKCLSQKAPFEDPRGPDFELSRPESRK